MSSRAHDDEPAREDARESPSRTPGSWLEPARSLQASLRGAGPIIGASYTLIGAILLLGGLGYLADSWLGTEPWLLLLGLVLGLVIGFYELARVVWR
jgi:F0F1-type ATP synthase assembly protein I